MSNANKLSKINEPISTLRKIQKIASNSIIAGGYFRDKFSDVPYNDIDIYIQPTYQKAALNNDVCDKEYWKGFFNLKVDDYGSMDNIAELGETDEEYDIINNNNIITVFEMTRNELRYNLIIINIDPIKYVEELFDFGICKNYCDGKKVTFTKEFMSDIEHKRLTFTDRAVSDANLNHAINVHLPKLQHKYPNFTVVFPPKYQKKYQQYKST